MKLYEIWSEGYRCTGDSGEAMLHGRIKADTFKEACIAFALKDRRFNPYFNPETMTYWGCRLFDNERNARKSFG